ncbi:Pseudouridylate synthase 7-like [Symbiodinium microadriaticum]|uniref:Pseudouridylate synthase 7-like n=1 Tax=Symbiodinium microadriaticum TaxID=2951 RepID=A0A1Q9DD19_SYMMI|nr:Pseudouridylate synthase 7-like [Symbiodinium microadriaticum]
MDSDDQKAPHVVVVKNTFIDLDDAPRMPTLARVATTPARYVESSKGIEDEDDTDEEGAEEDTGGQVEEGTDAPPPMPELYRVATYDEYEPETNWAWTVSSPIPDKPAGYSGGPAPIPSPMPIPAQPVPGSATIVVVPAPATMPMGGSPTPVPIPQGMAPPQRFDRWPQGIPTPTSLPEEPREASTSPRPADPPAPAAPRAPVLQRAFSVNSRIFRIHWTVDARVLKSSDREKVSPPFEVSMDGQEIQFKLCLRPSLTSESRGGASFRKAKGKGSVDMRCLSEISRTCVMTFRVAIGKGSESHKVSRTMKHDFSQKPICQLEGDDEWDFKTVTDEESQTFVVVLEVITIEVEPEHAVVAQRLAFHAGVSHKDVWSPGDVDMSETSKGWLAQSTRISALPGKLMFGLGKAPMFSAASKTATLVSSRFWQDLEILLDKDLLLPGAVILAACQDIEEHEFWGVLTNGRHRCSCGTSSMDEEAASLDEMCMQGSEVCSGRFAMEGVEDCMALAVYKPAPAGMLLNRTRETCHAGTTREIPEMVLDLESQARQCQNRDLESDEDMPGTETEDEMWTTDAEDAAMRGAASSHALGTGAGTRNRDHRGADHSDLGSSYKTGDTAGHTKVPFEDWAVFADGRVLAISPTPDVRTKSTIGLVLRFWALGHSLMMAPLQIGRDRRRRSITGVLLIAVLGTVIFHQLAAFAGGAIRQDRQGLRRHAARAAQASVSDLLTLADTESDDSKFEEQVTTRAEVLMRAQHARYHFRSPLRRRAYSPACPLSFADAGLTEFRSRGLQGFPAVLKRSLYDFQVHEVDLQGNELHLTELKLKDSHCCVPDGGRWHLHFRLYKEGLDTLDAVALLARCLGRSRRTLRFAGSKDRCAVTVQQMSCAQLSPAELQRALHHPDCESRVRVSDLAVKPSPVRLGDLLGNRFNVVLRMVPEQALLSPSSAAQEACRSLAESGFLNYFGPQRFGSQVIRSFHVGAAILRHQFDRAVRLILGDVELLGGDAARADAMTWDEELQAAQQSLLRAIRAGGDVVLAAEAAFQRVPPVPGYHVERGLLRCLARGLTAEEALFRLPRQVLMLFVKSAQSLIFNKVLSHRAALGPIPAEGDLVLQGGFGGEEPVPVELTKLASVEPESVVLPLPGSSVRYPRSLQQVYEEASEQLLQVSLEAFSSRLPLRLKLPGIYRPAISHEFWLER